MLFDMTHSPKMAGEGVGNVYISVCALLLIITSSLSYDEYTLENHKVCSYTRKRDIKLGEKQHSAIIFKETRYFDHWSGVFPFNCTFTVYAPQDYGIIAVIQELEFRKNETTGECIDFVQFQRRERKHSITEFFKRDKVRSIQHCGKVDFSHLPYKGSEEEFVNASNSFVDERGQMDVIIHVASKPLLPTESIDIKIVFTAFRSCRTIKYSGFYSCGQDICIWEGFTNDSLVNCPFTDCADEGACPNLNSGGKKLSSGIGTKVTIGAVVAILALLLLFLLCLFVCRHCQVLCWSTSTPARSQRSAAQTTTVEWTPHSMVSGDSGAVPQPTAPPLLPVPSAVSPVHEDKDLPPPYESLFPSR